PNARLAAVAHRRPEAAAEFAAKYGCDASSDLDALLARDDVDVIAVATPSGTHADIAIAAAARKKHCIVEKPIDIDLKKIDAAIRAHEEAGTRLGGIFNYRFLPTARLFKEAVDRNRFGRMTFGMAYGPWWRDQAYYDNGGWRG